MAQPPVVYRCGECEHLTEPVPDPLYTCTRCNRDFLRSHTRNDSHRCPYCGRFAKLVSQYSCGVCGIGPIYVEERSMRHAP